MSDVYREAYERLGSYRAAATELGVHHDTVRQALVRDNLRAPEGDPFVIKKQNTLRDRDGVVVQTWTTTVPEADQVKLSMEIMLEAMVKKVVPLKPIDRSPKHALSDLLSIYPVGDPHFGLLCHKEEVGEDFNVEMASDELCGAIDKLVSVTPQTEEALLLILGDLTHADDESAQTARSKNHLDVSARHHKVMSVVFDAVIYSIRRLLTHHKKVHVWLNRGNHDDQSAYSLSLMLAAWFRKDPRVIVNVEPGYIKYMRWFNNLIGSTHGHMVKGKNLTSVMACDRREDWGQTEHHFWYLGHIHHKTKEDNGSIAESFNTLAPGDSWHHAMGYRAKRRLESIQLHKQFGEIERHAVDIMMLKAA